MCGFLRETNEIFHVDSVGSLVIITHSVHFCLVQKYINELAGL